MFLKYAVGWTGVITLGGPCGTLFILNFWYHTFDLPIFIFCRGQFVESTQNLEEGKYYVIFKVQSMFVIKKNTLIRKLKIKALFTISFTLAKPCGSWLKMCIKRSTRVGCDACENEAPEYETCFRRSTLQTWIPRNLSSMDDGACVDT